MKKLFRRGLVVGKFSPLHRGHQSVIERALADCHEVVLISYSNPEFAGCESQKRADWLERLYPQTTRLVVNDELLARHAPSGLPRRVPQNDASDLDHRLFVGRLCRHVLGLPVDAVFTSEDYGDGFAAELTRFFSSEGFSTTEVKHVLVDKARTHIPVSGTQIREDVHDLREALHPSVYASFVRKICLLGGESTGKTTLGIALAEVLETSFVREYGRDLWIEKGGQLEFDDMLAIGRRQVELEDEGLLTARGYLICDTSPLTTASYSNHLFGTTSPDLQELAKRPYAHIALCLPDFPFIQDGTRVNDAFRLAQDAWYRQELSAQSTPWFGVGGTTEDRIRQITQKLGI